MKLKWINPPRHDRFLDEAVEEVNAVAPAGMDIVAVTEIPRARTHSGQLPPAFVVPVVIVSTALVGLSTGYLLGSVEVHHVEPARAARIADHDLAEDIMRVRRDAIENERRLDELRDRLRMIDDGSRRLRGLTAFTPGQRRP